MTDLITSLSKLDAPDREVDCEIHALFAEIPKGFVRGSSSGAYLIAHGKKGQVWTEKVPSYTASIDATIALAGRVLPGWVFDNVGQDFHSVPGGYEAFGWNVELINGTRVQGQAPTFPLAICIALLRAKEAGK